MSTLIISVLTSLQQSYTKNPFFGGSYRYEGNMQCWKKYITNVILYLYISLLHRFLIFVCIFHVSFFLIRKYSFQDIDLANRVNQLTKMQTDCPTCKKQHPPIFKSEAEQRLKYLPEIQKLHLYRYMSSHCPTYHTHVIPWYHLDHHCQIFNTSYYTLVLQKMAQKQSCHISSHYLAKSVLVWSRMGLPILPCCDGDCRSELRLLSLLESGGHLTQCPW